MAGRPSLEHTPVKLCVPAQGFAKAVALQSGHGNQLSLCPDSHVGLNGAHDPKRLLVFSLDGASAELRGYFG